MKIRDHLQWQDDTDLDAFITRLTDSEERVRQNVRQYVVGEKVRVRLDDMLKAVGQRLDDNRDVGRYIHGAFGSGKSNLMTVLGKMLERDDMVYDLGHSALRELRARHPWLDQHRTLVVRINMMGKTSLVKALFEGYNAALPAEVPKLEFTDEERVFALIERDAQRLGGLQALLEQAANDAAFESIPEMPRGMPGPLFVDFYQRLRKGDRDKRLVLAAALQNWRNHGEQAIRPDDLWVDAKQGLDRIARHAKEHGYTAIAWLIDELVIWIRGRSRAEYVNEINHLSALVDHDAARVLPFFVAVAVQMDISRTCPEDLSQRDFQDQLGFIRDRFQPQLELEDQDLYEVAAQRVLARRKDQAETTRKEFESAIDRAFDKHRDAIVGLSGGLELELVRKLYPFNPALLRILVDVTQALSRNRTAIAALYRLLNRHAELEVGQFIPVGALWDFVFEPENVSYVKQNSSSKLCQRLANTYDTWVRLEPKLESVAETSGTTVHQLSQVVRTVLLCQLSDRPYFQGGRSLSERILASTLLHLNETDIRTLLARTGTSKVASWFRKLNGVAPHVQVVGETDPHVSIKIEQLDIERVLETARAQVGHSHRFAFMRKLLMEELGLDLGTSNEGTRDVLWRGTRRRGRVKLANVRTLSYAGQVNEFDPGRDDFLIVVDYPFDEVSGMSRQDDVDNCTRARGRGAHWTLAWLPEHLAPSEFEALTNAAAVEVIRQDPRAAFKDLSPHEADAASRMLEGYQGDRRRELAAAVRKLFFDRGQVQGMKAALDGIDATGLELTSALDRLARTVLDKRYPNHPNFTRRVSPAELAQVADWVVRAAKLGTTVDLKVNEMALVDAILVPLELCHRGPSGITGRSDGRYLSAVTAWVGTKTRVEAHELRAALMADADGERSGFGLTKEVANLLIYHLLQVAGFEAQIDTRSETIHGLADIKDRFSLVKEEVVDAPTWDKALHVAKRFFELKGRSDLPSPPEQSKLFRDVGKVAEPTLKALADFEKALSEVCEWAGVSPESSARLESVSRVVGWIREVLSDTNNASRVRRLAAMSAEMRFDELASWPAKLPKEASALHQIEGQRSAVKHFGAEGSEDDRTVVVVRLRNLLTDPLSVSALADRVPDWVDEVKRRFGRVAEDSARRAREEERRREEAQQKAQEAGKREAAERERREAAERARREAEQQREAALLAQAEAERKLEEAKRREEAERTRTRTVVGKREALAKAVQRELAELLDANPGSVQMRVRLVIEPVDSEGEKR